MAFFLGGWSNIPILGCITLMMLLFFEGFCLWPTWDTCIA